MAVEVGVLYAANSKWPTPNVWHKPPGPVRRQRPVVTKDDVAHAKEAQYKQQMRKYRKIQKTELFLAISQRNVLKVQQLLASNSTLLEGHADDGATPLTLASAVGDEATCAHLLELGADVMAADHVGATPLIRAAFRGHIGVVKQLLGSRQGANAGREALLQQRTRGGETALMAAAKAGHTDVVQVLLTAGASPADTDNNGMSALMMACRKNRLPVVKLLSEAGADMTAVDKHGCSALMHAAHGAAAEVVRFLLAQHSAEQLPALLRSRDGNGLTPLGYACLGGSHPVVKLLLASAAAATVPLAEAAGSRRSLLSLACEGGSRALVQELLKDNTLVDSSELVQDGQDSPVHTAARHRSFDVLELLLEKGARIEARDKHGRTPLAAAAVAGMNDIVKFLVRHGADLRATDDAGRVPRQLAYHHQHLDTALLLSSLARDRLIEMEGDFYPEILAEEHAAGTVLVPAH